MAHYHTLVVLVENTPGVLARVSGLFARRGFNIESLAVAPTEDPTLSRFTIVVDGESVSMDQIKNQLDKLINVVEIRELLPAESEQQELIMIKLGYLNGKASGSGSGSGGAVLQELIGKYSVRVLAENNSGIILSMTGLQEEVQDLETTLESLEGFEIMEIQRTGKIAISSL